MSFVLVGNKRIRESIDALISSNRLPHAIIIEGELGTGRRTLADFLSKAAVCESQSSPCDECRSCHLADAHTHPDIQSIAPEDKKKNIAVEQIRALRTQAYHSAHTSSRRVFIIEQAETMNPQSQNTLLKILEEPPSDVIFILITTSAERLLETVVSRCVVFSLFPPSFEEALTYLKAQGVDEGKASALLKDEKNNIGKALARLKSKKDSVGRSAAREFLDAIESGSALSALLSAVCLEKNRPEASKFTEELSELLVEKIKASQNLPETAREYTGMYNILCELTPTLDTNINLSLFFSALAIKLSAVKNR